MSITNIAIATVTVGSGGAGTIEFTNIPQTYTDLYILVSARSDRSLHVDDYRILFNSSSASFSYRALLASSGTSTLSGNVNEVGVMSANTALSSTFGNGLIYIYNYTSSSNKTYRTEAVSSNNSSSSENWIVGGLWSNTSAITTIALDQGDGSNWLQYSTATLYGIKNN